MMSFDICYRWKCSATDTTHRRRNRRHQKSVSRHTLSSCLIIRLCSRLLYSVISAVRTVCFRRSRDSHSNDDEAMLSSVASEICPRECTHRERGEGGECGATGRGAATPRRAGRLVRLLSRRPSAARAYCTGDAFTSSHRRYSMPIDGRLQRHVAAWSTSYYANWSVGLEREQLRLHSLAIEFARRTE